MVANGDSDAADAALAAKANSTMSRTRSVRVRLQEKVFAGRDEPVEENEPSKHALGGYHMFGSESKDAPMDTEAAAVLQEFKMKQASPDEIRKEGFLAKRCQNGCQNGQNGHEWDLRKVILTNDALLLGNPHTGEFRDSLMLTHMSQIREMVKVEEQTPEHSQSFRNRLQKSVVNRAKTLSGALPGSAGSPGLPKTLSRSQSEDALDSLEAQYWDSTIEIVSDFYGGC